MSQRHITSAGPLSLARSTLLSSYGWHGCVFKHAPQYHNEGVQPSLTFRPSLNRLLRGRGLVPLWVQKAASHFQWRIHAPPSDAVDERHPIVARRPDYRKDSDHLFSSWATWRCSTRLRRLPTPRSGTPLDTSMAGIVPVAHVAICWTAGPWRERRRRRRVAQPRDKPRWLRHRGAPCSP